MKTLCIFVFLIMLFPYKFINAQASQIELVVSNQSGHTIYMQCYPISMTMNGDNKYSLDALHNYDFQGKSFDYNNATCLTGGNNYLNTIFEIPYVDIEDPNYEQSSNPGFNFDGKEEIATSSASGSFGRGIYKLTLEIIYMDLQLIRF